MPVRPKVVFVCTHYAGKSRLAEAYLRTVAGDRFEVISAGTEPGDSANPAAVEAAKDAGLDLREGPGVRVTPEMVEGAEVVVTFACGIDGLDSDVRVEDWDLIDDSGRPLKDYNDVRDAITRRVDDLVERLNKRS